MMKFELAVFLFLFVLSCKSQDDAIVVSWIQSIPGQAGKTQGIEFKADGSASSINMHTLIFETWTWNKGRGKIILTGKSIGNGQTISFKDSLVV